MFKWATDWAKKNKAPASHQGCWVQRLLEVLLRYILIDFFYFAVFKIESSFFKKMRVWWTPRLRNKGYSWEGKVYKLCGILKRDWSSPCTMEKRLQCTWLPSDAHKKSWGGSWRQMRGGAHGSWVLWSFSRWGQKPPRNAPDFSLLKLLGMSY